RSPALGSARVRFATGNGFDRMAAIRCRSASRRNAGSAGRSLGTTAASTLSSPPIELLALGGEGRGTRASFALKDDMRPPRYQQIQLARCEQGHCLPHRNTVAYNPKIVASLES